MNLFNLQNNGLKLINLPTGFGKTHMMLEYIINHLENDKLERVFVVANQHKLLDYEKFINMLKERGLEKYISKCDKYKSMQEHLYDFIKSDKYYDFINSDDCKTIKKELERAKKDFETNYNLEKEASKHEKKFRKLIKNLDKKTIYQIYPQVDFLNKKVVFLTIHKFLSPFDLVKNQVIFKDDKPYEIKTLNLIDNLQDDIVFIDEFDKSKETIFDYLLNLQDGRECIIELFRVIFSGILQSEKRLETFLKNKLELKQIINSLNNFEKIKELGSEIYKKFNLEYPYKTIDVEENNNFIIQSNRTYISVLGNGKSHIILDFNKERNQVDIKTVNKDESKSAKYNIFELIRSINKFLRQVGFYLENTATMIEKHAKDIQNNKSKTIYDKSNYKYSLAHELMISNEHLKHLEATATNYKKNKKIISDISHYSQGLSYFHLKDSDNHLGSTHIDFFTSYSNPEKILLELCYKAKVYGISATATIKSVYSNYNLTYLRKMLDENYIELDYDEIVQIQDKLDKKRKIYNDININIKTIDKCKYKLIEEKIGEDCFASAKDFEKDRLLELFSVIDEFSTHKSSQTLLFLNRANSSKSKDNEYSQDKILELMKEFYKNIKCIFVDSENYDSLSSILAKTLGKNKKVVVISSYASIGAGVNLQYDKAFYKGDLLSYKTLNYIDDKKDFDEIFLGDLTYSEPVLNDETTNNERLKYLYLLQEFYYLGLLIQKDFKDNVKTIFRANGYNSMNLKHKKHFDLAMVSQIIQAIGRITRTNNKNKNIYIYYSLNLIDRFNDIVFANEIFEYEFLPPETQKLFDDLQEKIKKPKPMQNDMIINKANYISDQGHKFIKGLLARNWSDDDIALWKQLREIVLKYPTITKRKLKELEKPVRQIIKEFYFLHNKEHYFYTNEGDFKEVNVYFDKPDLHCYQVSQNNAKLDVLLKNPLISKFFEDNEFATSFKCCDFKNEDEFYILSPVLFQNIYKGSLGEFVGKCILDDYFNDFCSEFSLGELDSEHYEFFDFVLEKNSEKLPVYIDFKHWRLSYKSDEFLIADEIKAKMKSLDAKVLFIINLLAGYDEFSIREINEDGLKMVILPYLIDENNSQINNKALEVFFENIKDFK